MADIFISYRREDSSGHAGRLYDRLVDRFGTGRVFMDIDTIQPGTDFNAEIERVLKRCAVGLVVIGRRWLEMLGQWRAVDYLKAEIIAALGRGSRVRVIPVLVDGAELPDRWRLPSDLQALVDRHAFHLSNRTFTHDANKLIAAISRVVRPSTPRKAKSQTKKQPRTRGTGDGEARTAAPRRSGPGAKAPTTRKPEVRPDPTKNTEARRAGGDGEPVAAPKRPKAPPRAAKQESSSATQRTGQTRTASSGQTGARDAKPSAPKTSTRGRNPAEKKPKEIRTGATRPSGGSSAAPRKKGGQDGAAAANNKRRRSTKKR